VRSVRHHVATAADADATVDRTAAARVVVHSHVCRLRKYIQPRVLHYNIILIFPLRIQWRGKREMAIQSNVVSTHLESNTEAHLLSYFLPTYRNKIVYLSLYIFIRWSVFAPPLVIILSKL
jgi:hypothetical protein